MHFRVLAGVLSAILALGGLGLPAAFAQTPSPSTEDLPPTPPPAVLPAVPTVAPGYGPPVTAPLPNGDIVGVAQLPFVGIGLNDAIGMALQRNTDLAIAISNQRVAAYEIVAAKGAGDIAFQVQPQYSYNISPIINPLETGPNGLPVTQIDHGISAGFLGQTLTGTRYNVSVSGQNIYNNTALNAYNNFFETAINLQLTQPLLRGSGSGAPGEHQLQLARANQHGQTAALLTQVSQTITNVSDTYWNLVAAWRNVAIQEEGLRNAQAQAASNQRLADRGAAAPVDVVESNTQVYVFQDNVFSALQAVQALQTQLKQQILASPVDPLWSANVVPTSSALQLPPTPNLDDLIAEALQNRPELSQLRAERQTVDANLAYAKNQKLPQLDLGVNVGYNGFGGTPVNLGAVPFFNSLALQNSALNQLIAASGLPIPPIPATQFTIPGYQNGGLGTAWNTLFAGRFPSYSAQLTLQLPLTNRTAKADYAIAEEQAKQVGVQEYALLQRIRAEAANAIQTLRETQYRLSAATAARVAAQRVLLSEQRRFENGTSTTFLVLQRQLDVANTEGRELQAQTDMNKAVDELDRVAGTDFALYNIDVSKLTSQTLEVVSPTTDVLPLPPDAQVSPPQLHQ